ncbi:MAG: hypothetical protein ABSD97_04220 [Acidimicrobiales bacterium]
MRERSTAAAGVGTYLEPLEALPALRTRALRPAPAFLDFAFVTASPSGSDTLFLNPRSPWQNALIKSFAVGCATSRLA